MAVWSLGPWAHFDYAFSPVGVDFSGKVAIPNAGGGTRTTRGVAPAEGGDESASLGDRRAEHRDHHNDVSYVPAKPGAGAPKNACSSCI